MGSPASSSEALPHMARIADDLCVVRSMHTEAINHDPAITFFQTGFQIAGRPSMGSWLSYGMGSENDQLPGFVVMVSNRGGQPLYHRLWGSGFLPLFIKGSNSAQGRSGAVFIRPQRLDQRSQAADFGRSHGLEHGILRTNWRSRDSDAHGPI